MNDSARRHSYTRCLSEGVKTPNRLLLSTIVRYWKTSYPLGGLVLSCVTAFGLVVVRRPSYPFGELELCYGLWPCCCLKAKLSLQETWVVLRPWALLLFEDQVIPSGNLSFVTAFGLVVVWRPSCPFGELELCYGLWPCCCLKAKLSLRETWVVLRPLALLLFEGQVIPSGNLSSVTAFGLVVVWRPSYPFGKLE